MRQGVLRVARLVGLFGLMLPIGTLVAEPSSPAPVKILQVRPYANSYSVYIDVSSGQLCGTSAFVIMTHEPGGKEMYAAALTALTTGKRVILEVSNTTGCTGWGTKLQSLYVLAN